MKPRFSTDCDAYLGDGIQATHPVGDSVRAVGEADIFGPGSELACHSETLAALRHPLSWLDSKAYEILVVTLLVLFCYLFYTYRKNLGLVVKTLLRRTPLEKAYGEQTLAFKYSLRLFQLFAALLTTGIFIRIVVFFGIPARFPLLSVLQINLIVPAVLLIIGFAASYRTLAIRIISGVTTGRPFFSQYRFLTALFYALGSFILTPFFLLCALYDGSAAYLLVYLLIGLCGAGVLIYLKLSAQFFIERNVSILQWILYLCAVEFLPFSFLCFLWIRNMA